jgi:hypothetical protein
LDDLREMDPDFTSRPNDLKSQGRGSGMLCAGSLFGFRNKKSASFLALLGSCKRISKLTLHTS